MWKIFQINSIRYRMLSGFLFLAVIILALAIISFNAVNRNRQILGVHLIVTELQVSNLNIIKLQNEYLRNEVINESYFETENSKILVARDSILIDVEQNLKRLAVQSEELNYPIGREISRIDSLTKICNHNFKMLVEYSFQSGFKDFGIEGKMREHAHMLENPSLHMELADVLSLRRREKDFLLREDTIYVALFNNEFEKLSRKLQVDPGKYRESIYHLNQYHNLFNQLVGLKTLMGLKGGTGFMHELNLSTSKLNEEYYNLAEYSRELSYSIQKNTMFIYIMTLAGVLLFAIVSSFWISKRLSAPIATLSKWIDHKSSNNNIVKEPIMLDTAADEIRALTQSFANLLTQRDEQMAEIRLKSKQLKNRNKELKKINSELDSFLYSTAHDLRSPLSSLLGLIRLIQLENKQDDLKSYFSMMQNSVHRLEDFLQQIVDYSKNKKTNLVPEKIDLEKLVGETFSNHDFLEGADKIQKIIDIKEECAFYSDKNRMHVIFNNLVSNAIRYSDSKKSLQYIKIKIVVNEEQFTLEFSDNGIGIEKEFLSKIFDMFYRANTKSKGSGLGLFLFKETIQRMNGHATVESDIDVGTKFFIRLPNLIKSTKDQSLALIKQN